MESFFVPDAKTAVLLLLYSLWVLPWKGVALWKAVKRNEMKWFIALLVLNTIAILEILYIFVFSRRDRSTETVAIAPTSPKEREYELEQRVRKSAGKEKILEAAKEWGKISLETAGSLIDVPDEEAAEYLEELRSEGKIRRVEKADGDVIYRPR